MNNGLQTPASEGMPKLIRWFGTRGALGAWIVIGLLYVGFVGGAGVVLMSHALRDGQWLRTTLLAAILLLALTVWFRIWMINWRALQSDWPPIRPEDTGVWGVGGPGIRQPGATGMFQKPKIVEDDEPGGG